MKQREWDALIILAEAEGPVIVNPRAPRGAYYLMVFSDLTRKGLAQFDHLGFWIAPAGVLELGIPLQ